MRRNSFTPEKKKKFLDLLAKTGIVSHSAVAAGVTRRIVYYHRKDDEEFAKAWDDAEKQAADVLEKEARRRAIEGVLEPVFYRGEERGVVRKYSDTLLIFLMKGCNKERYGDRVQVGGAVTVKSHIPDRETECPKQ